MTRWHAPDGHNAGRGSWDAPEAVHVHAFTHRKVNAYRAEAYCECGSRAAILSQEYGQPPAAVIVEVRGGNGDVRETATYERADR